MLKFGHPDQAIRHYLPEVLAVGADAEAAARGILEAIRQVASARTVIQEFAQSQGWDFDDCPIFDHLDEVLVTCELEREISRLCRWIKENNIKVCDSFFIEVNCLANKSKDLFIKPYNKNASVDSFKRVVNFIVNNHDDLHHLGDKLYKSGNRILGAACYVLCSLRHPWSPASQELADGIYCLNILGNNWTYTYSAGTFVVDDGADRQKS